VNVPDKLNPKMRAKNGGGWILGIYEHGAPSAFEYGVPDSFLGRSFPAGIWTGRGFSNGDARTCAAPAADSGLKDDFNGPNLLYA